MTRCKGSGQFLAPSGLPDSPLHQNKYQHGKHSCMKSLAYAVLHSIRIHMHMHIPARMHVFSRRTHAAPKRFPSHCTSFWRLAPGNAYVTQETSVSTIYISVELALEQLTCLRTDCQTRMFTIAAVCSLFDPAPSAPVGFLSDLRALVDNRVASCDAGSTARPGLHPWPQI